MNKIKQSFSKFGILLFSFLLIACASQQSFNEFQSSVSFSSEQKTNVEQQEDIEAEINHLQAFLNRSTKAAENADAKTQYAIGKSYYYGPEVFPMDKEKAFYWYKKAAKKGHVEAQYMLGYMYSLGKGVPKDLEKAFYWYKKAAENGHAKAQYRLRADRGDAKAQYSLGKEYYDGKGVSQSSKKALYWLEKAAEQGHVEAQYSLGLMYYDGKGVPGWIPKDHKKAAHWFEKAAKQGHAPAIKKLKEITRK